MSSRLTPLVRIGTAGGEVLRALRQDEPGAHPVAEAYFSRLDPGAVRAWKFHRQMTVNAVVPVGHVRFVVIDGDPDGDDPVEFVTYDLGPERQYGRLTIDPGTWFGFRGGAEGGLVLNLADILHHPDEGDSRDADAFDHDWDTPAP